MKLIQDILAELGGPTGSALKHTETLKAIEVAINEDNRRDIKVIGVKGKQLLLQVDHAGRATQLQYRQFALLSKLHHAGLVTNVSELKVKVRPKVPSRLQLPRQPKAISSENRHHLKSQATVLVNPDLQRIFTKLSERDV